MKYVCDRKFIDVYTCMCKQETHQMR